MSHLNKDGLDSISEGCFLVMPTKRKRSSSIKPTSKRKNTKQKNINYEFRDESDKELAYNGYQQLFNGREPVRSMLKRKELFEHSWDRMNDTINSIFLDMNESVVKNIEQFVENAYDSEQSLTSNEIPTALIFAGINSSDHDTQFSSIRSYLQNNSSDQGKRRNLFALLQSKDCPNLANMMKEMISQFTMHGVTRTTFEGKEDSEGESDEEIIRLIKPSSTKYQLGTASVKLSKCGNNDMQKLEGWHKAVTLADKRKPNLVIMLQDFESFDPLVMQDFINICSLYHTRMRIILVMGIATSMDTFFQSFNTATIGLLRTEKFKLEQSEVWFNKVLEKVFLQSTETLKFGPRPYKFLLDRFYLYDFSISNVKASLKYALMHHYYGNPLSLFLSLLEENLPTMKKKVKGWWVEGMFTEDHILSIRMLPSFRTFVESMAIFNPKEALHILEDDEYLILNTIPMLLSHMKVYQAEFRVGIKLIQTLQAQFPTVDSIRRNVRILLLDTLQGHENTEDKINLIKLLLKLIKTMKMDQIGKLIKNLRPLFSVDEISKNGKKALEILDEWEERYKSLQNDTSSSQTDMIEGMVAGKEGGRDTETSRKVQSETLEYIKKKGSEATKFTIEIADWCETKLIQYLRPFTDLPLHELVYYTNVRLHEKSFAAEQRASIQTALIQSEHYLNCSCCNSEKADQILPSEGDTSILYKLYLECGRMINLYDWFVAFGSIVQKEHRARKKLEEKEVQARFIQSVAQLQYLGFIKPTQRKTDHVIRLTWSNI